MRKTHLELARREYQKASSSLGQHINQKREEPDNPATPESHRILESYGKHPGVFRRESCRHLTPT